jgi:hypothetical protein
LVLSAGPIGTKPYVDLGPSDNVAWDQPRVAVQFITDAEEVIGPNIFNSWLLDTGANSTLVFRTAVSDMNELPPRYTTEGVFHEIGVGGIQEFDVSSPYRFDFAGASGIRNTLPDTRVLSDPDNDISIFGPWGIVGMPAMTDRVTTFDFTGWTDLPDLLDLLMKTEFGDTLPPYVGDRYSVKVDNRVSFAPEPQVVSGIHPPSWADIPFLTGQLAHNDKVVEGNFLYDTGAQVSILSTAMALGLDLDSNLDGVLNEFDANFARYETVGGIGGTRTVPVMLIDEVHIPTEEGPDLVWTDLQWLILDIVDGIDAVFGFDNMTSGWIEAFSISGQSGYIMQAHADFRSWSTTGEGLIHFDINPEIHTLVDPSGPGAEINESGGLTTVSESNVDDTYEIVLTQPPTADVTVTLLSSSQVTAVDAAHPNNDYLVFTPANWNVAQVVQVAAIDDPFQESFHRGHVRHMSASDDSNYQNAGMPRVVVNIIDNDFPGVMIIPSEGATEVAEGGATDTYELVLAHPTTNDVYIELEHLSNQVTAVSAVGGSDTLVFTPANWDDPQAVLVTAVEDALAEGPHVGYITHRISTSDAGYQQAFALQELAFISDNDDDDVTPPKVLDVIAGSSSSGSGFIDAVDGGGVGGGNGMGLSLPGSEQLRNLTGTAINRIYIEFSEDVSASFTDAHLALAGTNVADYMTSAVLTYGVDGPNIGTITLSSPIANDALILAIFDTLTDTAENALDGEWTTGVSLESGNGAAGGQFNFRIDVLPGDVNDNGGVNTIDVLQTNAEIGTVVASQDDAIYDVNGNGGVNITDVLTINARVGTILPAAPQIPSPSPVGAAAGGLAAAGELGLAGRPFIFRIERPSVGGLPGIDRLPLQTDPFGSGVDFSIPSGPFAAAGSNDSADRSVEDAFDLNENGAADYFAELVASERASQESRAGSRSQESVIAQGLLEIDELMESFLDAENDLIDTGLMETDRLR